MAIDRVKLAVAAALDGNLGWNRSEFGVVMCGTLNSRLSNLHNFLS